MRLQGKIFQVIPSEVESVIQEHPCVQAAGVIGIPNPETGHVARAYIVVKPGHHVTTDEIKQHVAVRMRYFEHLYGGVRFLDALPENRNGKLDRLKLREFANAEEKERQ
jgi:acyl-coenzyme A synthetase/AMP-(fatty) acid ligase